MIVSEVVTIYCVHKLFYLSFSFFIHKYIQWCELGLFVLVFVLICFSQVICTQIYLTMCLFVLYILPWYTKYFFFFFRWLARSLSLSVSFYLRACSYREYTAKTRSKVNCCFNVELQGYMPPFSERKNLWYANTIFTSPSHLYQRSRTARNQRVPILLVRRS